MIRYVIDPTGLTTPLVLRGSGAPAAAHRALGRATHPAMLAGQPGPMINAGITSLDSLVPTRIGDAALRRSLSRLRQKAAASPAWSPGTVALPRTPAAPPPRRRLRSDGTRQVGAAAPLRREPAWPLSPLPPRFEGSDGSEGSAQTWLQHAAGPTGAAARKILLTGRWLSRMRIIDMARLDGGPRSRSPEPSAEGAPPAASHTATGAPPSSRPAPSPSALSADATAIEGAPSTAPTRNERPPGIPAGNGLGDLVQLWERRSTGDAELAANDLRRGQEATAQDRDRAVYGSEDETAADANRPAERAPTVGRHASRDHAVADAPDLGDEALLLEMLERALRSEARRHGIQLDTGGLW